MAEMGIRELRANAAAAVRRAEQGERLIITVNGQPVAQLGPISPVDTSPTLTDLAAQGLVILPHRTDRPAAGTVVALWPGARLDRLVSEVRGR
jgi:prevent-host-death family protein